MQSGPQVSDLDLLDDKQDISANVIGEMPKYTVKKYNRGFILAILGIVVFLSLGYLSYLFYQYLTLKSRPELPTEKIESIQKTSDAYNEYGGML